MGRGIRTRRWASASVLVSLAMILAACTMPPGGGGGATTTTTTVPSGKPTAVASANPTVGDAPYTVFFDSAGSSPGTGTGLTYEWDFATATRPRVRRRRTCTRPSVCSSRS